MEIRCPLCGSKIPFEDVNVSTDLALCRACGGSARFSEIADDSQSGAPDLNSPPSGASFEQTPEGFRIEASIRSWMAIFYEPFTCAWAGGSLSGIYGRQIVSGHFDLFSSISGLPFLLGSCALITLCAFTTAGKIVLTGSGDGLSIFTGVGSLGWTRSDAWSDFQWVREDARLRSYSANIGRRIIALEGKRRVTFGTMLSEDRSYFVLNVLRAMLRNSPSYGVSTTILPRYSRSADGGVGFHE